jgi:succinate-semialdehyde dehydrogenase/glutarate-semialdehyde dehydrogenase
VADEFTEKFGARVRAMKLGAGYDFAADMGSLISEDQVKTVSGHVDDAKVKGAKVIAGGKARPDVGPLFYEPTVLTGVTDEMECARNETFGPLVSIYPVDSIDEAIDRANDTEYGLNASVWAGSKAEGEAIAARLRSGTVNVDEGYAPAFGSTAAPMGGMKASGVGRRHGPDGLLKYTESQTVATSRVMTLDPPKGVSQNVWQRSFVPLFRVVQRLPGR